jgi:SIR2-like domain
MAKHGIKLADLRSVLNPSEFGGWTLCVGAGASIPLFPTWQHLVQSLLTSGPSAVSPIEAESLRQSFPPEALIRASQELLGMEDDAYRRHLTETLYSTIQKRASGLWPTIAKCLMSRLPGSSLASEWREYFAFVSAAGTTAAKLAEVVLQSVEKNKAPTAILSFNAEPLLYSMINAEATLRFRRRKSVPDADDAQNGPGVVDRIEGSTSWAKKGRIPYYFCHGFLPAQQPGSKVLPGTSPAALYESKMVFSESDYLSLANNVFSWQSSVFLRAAMSDLVVFVGLSLTDPNMRRWLAWNHSQRLDEIRTRRPLIKESTQHFWINVTSGSESIDRWTDALVSHLGIRLVWIENWSEVGTALERMLGLAK